MRVIIFGAGAMGCLFGAWLSQKARVTLCDVHRATVEHIAADGVVVTGMDKSVRRYPIEIIGRAQQYREQADLAIIFTKAHATRKAAESARELLGAGGMVLSLQNGVGNVEQIDTVFGRPIAIAGITAQAANVLSPGHTCHAGAGMTLLAARPGQEHQVQQVRQLFNQAEIECQVSDDADGLIWGKLLVNVGINALAALLRVNNGVLAEVDGCREIMADAVGEAAAVAAALKINLPYDEPMETVAKVCRDTAANRASMLQDTLRRKVTEIEVINGAIVSKGREVGVATPVNEMLTRMIKALEATYTRRVQEIPAGG